MKRRPFIATLAAGALSASGRAVARGVQPARRNFMAPCASGATWRGVTITWKSGPSTGATSAVPKSPASWSRAGSRPDGDITGRSTITAELDPKRLEPPRQAVPNLVSLAVLIVVLASAPGATGCCST